MTTIYSIDSEGRLFTDREQHFFLDSQLIRERSYYIRRQYLLDQIAKLIGYDDFDGLDTYLRCSGVTSDVLDSWIASESLTKNLLHIS